MPTSILCMGTYYSIYICLHTRCDFKIKQNTIMNTVGDVFVETTLICL